MVDRDEQEIWRNFGSEEFVDENDVPDRASDLKQLTDKWLNKHTHYFDLFNWRSIDEQLYRNKAFNEAGVYLLSGLNHGGGCKTPALERLLTRRVNDRRFMQLVLRNQKEFHYFVYPILYTKYIDNLETDIKSAVKHILSRGEFWSSERLPYRYLELCYLSNVFDIKNDIEEDNLINWTLLNHQPNILLSDVSDAYSFTHDIMMCYNDKLYYNEVTNSTTLGSPDSFDVINEIRGLILRFMAAGDTDITLELLLSGILTGQISREMVRLVFSWIIEKTQSLGYVPGPLSKSMSSIEVAKKDFEKKKSYWNYEYHDEGDEIWARNYHTNIVAGITARVLERNWPELESRRRHHTFEEYHYRENIMGLGQLLDSLANYNLKKASQQMIDLAGTDVSTKFPFVFNEAIEFMENQQNPDGGFGYWTTEEILYTNKGNSQESFYNDLVKPVSKQCRKALNATKPEGE